MSCTRWGRRGSNLSLRDAVALAQTLLDALRLGQDPGSAAVLAAYENSRRNDVDARVFGTDLLNRVVSTRSPFLRHLRRAGFRTLDNFGFLREFAMRRGMAAGVKSA